MTLLPVPIVVRRAKKLLGEIGTHEGRQLIFMLQVERTLPGKPFFGPAFDFALRKLEAPARFETFRNMLILDLEWTKAYHRVGLRRMEEVDRAIQRRLHGKVNGALVLTLVDLGVVSTVEALDNVPQRSGRYYQNVELTKDALHRFRQVVLQLRAAGVAATSIPRLVQLDIERFDPASLKDTLHILGLNDADLSKVLETLGEQLLLAKPKRWKFLIDEFDARMPADLGRFADFLDSGRTPSPEFVRALRAAGAAMADLEACQTLVLDVGERQEPPPLAELRLLIAPPHSLALSQLPAARDYLLARRDLRSYLRVLAQHGFDDAQSLLAFQPCYRQLSSDVLSRWLAIASKAAKGQSATAIAEWTVQAGKSGEFESFEYLAAAGELHSFADLQRALKLAPLGMPLLRYIREVRGITGLTALLKWYFRDAPGINEVRLGKIDVATRVLLDDAFGRKDFTLLEGNARIVEETIHQRVEARLGRVPLLSDESAREQEWQRRKKMREEIRAELAPGLQTMLQLSDGLLLSSLLEHIGAPQEVFRSKLALLDPELAKLRSGGGPTNAVLSDLEADLIALVYRTTASNVRHQWKSVIGRESDLAWLRHVGPYAMSWVRTEQRIDGQLDLRGIRALKQALSFAVRFISANDMHDACRRLSPKRLRDPAADVWSLASHLGVLLAIAADDSNVRKWLDDGETAIEAMEQGGPLVYQHLESLHQLFDVQLGDALDALEPCFRDGLTEFDAALLASRLDKRSGATISAAEASLGDALSNTRHTVLDMFLRWADGQKRLFSPRALEDGATRVLAYVSKSPAAFFAKEAAGICTRSNTAMWQESRNAHLLVFAPCHKRLVGMALLYFERVAALDTTRDSLIIRAINPMTEAHASFSVSSIVDSFFDAAVQIARHNGLAAVAFPSPAGMHFMSNHQAVENDIRDRFIERSRPERRETTDQDAPRLWDEPAAVKAQFYAYESGQSLVTELYAIWRSAV